MLNANPTAATPWPRVRDVDSAALSPFDAGHNGRPAAAVDSFSSPLVKSLTRSDCFCSHNRAPDELTPASNWSAVAVPVPLADAFDYLAAPGRRRCRRSAAACECRSAAASGSASSSSIRRRPTLPPEQLKTIRERARREPADRRRAPASLRWAAEYYHHPFGAVLSHALPGLLREGRAHRRAARARVAAHGARAGSGPRAARRARARQQARALAALRERGR